MNKLRPRFVIILVVISLVACAPIPQFKIKRVVGLTPTDRLPELEVTRAPVTARANQAFTVTVITYGSSSCTAVDGADVAVDGSVATITPHDRLPLGGACTADLAAHPRDVQVTFSVAGPAIIQVIGTNFAGEPLTTNKHITIMP